MAEVLPTGETANRLDGDALAVRKIMDFVATYVRGLPQEYNYYEQTIHHYKQTPCLACLDKSEDYRKSIFDSLVVIDEILEAYEYPYISWQPAGQPAAPLIGRTLKTYVAFKEQEPLSVGFFVGPFRSDPRRQVIRQEMVEQIPANLILSLIPTHEILNGQSVSGYNISHAPTPPPNQTPSHTTLLEPLTIDHGPITEQPINTRRFEFRTASRPAGPLSGI